MNNLLAEMFLETTLAHVCKCDVNVRNKNTSRPNLRDNSATGRRRHVRTTQRFSFFSSFSSRSPSLSTELFVSVFLSFFLSLATLSINVSDFSISISRANSLAHVPPLIAPFRYQFRPEQEEQAGH